MIHALGEMALRAGIQSILGNFDRSMLRLYRHFGCEVDVLGATRRYGPPVFLGCFPVNKATVDQLSRRKAALNENFRMRNLAVA
jgi:N-acyl-L-homoserine lactone synthetase